MIIIITITLLFKQNLPNILWFQPLKCDNVLLFFVFYHYKLNKIA